MRKQWETPKTERMRTSRSHLVASVTHDAAVQVLGQTNTQPVSDSNPTELTRALLSQHNTITVSFAAKSTKENPIIRMKTHLQAQHTAASAPQINCILYPMQKLNKKIRSFRNTTLFLWECSFEHSFSRWRPLEILQKCDSIRYTSWICTNPKRYFDSPIPRSDYLRLPLKDTLAQFDLWGFSKFSDLELATLCTCVVV